MSPSVTASRPAHKAAADRSTAPAEPAPVHAAPAPVRHSLYQLRRQSHLNHRGHEILAAAERLLRLVDALEDSTAQTDLVAATAKATPADTEFDLGCLENLAADCAGFRWVLNVFVEALQCSVIPLPDDPDLVAAPTTPKAAGRKAVKSR